MNRRITRLQQETKVGEQEDSRLQKEKKVGEQEDGTAIKKKKKITASLKLAILSFLMMSYRLQKCNSK